MATAPTAPQGEWVLLRHLTTIADDADWVATQDFAAATAAGVLRIPYGNSEIGIFSVRLVWLDVAGEAVAGLGSFDLKPIEITDDVNPVTGAPLRAVTDSLVKAATGYARYDLSAAKAAQLFTVRLTSIVAPATTTQALVYLMVS